MALFKRSKMRILGSLVIFSFLAFCLYTIFKFDNFETATEHQQPIIITDSNNEDDEDINDTNNSNLTQNSNNYDTSINDNIITNDNDNELLDNNDLELKQNINTNSNTYINASNINHTTDTPFINPLLLSQCRNAILNNDNLEITQRISDQALQCKSFNGIYTREGLDAFAGVNQTCPYNHQSVRTHEYVMNYLKKYHNLKDNGIRDNEYGNSTDAYRKWYNKFPIYYMIPKAGSSTTHKILSWTNKYGHLGGIVGQQVGWENIISPSTCAFTLVRNPIARLISGYYTINVHLWRYLKGGFFNLYNETIRKPGNVWQYMYVKYEPQRFRTFVEELINEPNKFTSSGGNEHIISASTFLAAWVGTNRTNDMTYIGKVENYPLDMQKIMRKCDYFTDKDIQLVSDDRRSHEMHGFGWHSPSSWIAEFDKYGNWVEWMSLFPLLHHWQATRSVKNILPPAYYAIDETLYKKIVNYYIQDIICFDYKNESSFDNFKAYRDSYLNIYEMYKNYSTTVNTTTIISDH